MAIQKRTTSTGKTRWIARWRTPDGREHSRSFDTRREATSHLADIDRRRRAGKQEPGKITVQQMYNEWLNSRPLRQTSRELYEYTRDTHLPPLADYPAAEVTAADITEWQHALRTGRRWLSRSDTGISDTGTRNALRHLRSAYTWGVNEGHVAKNPVKIPPADSAIEPEQLPTADEINTVIALVRSGGAKYQTKRTAAGEPREAVQDPHPTIADMLTVAAYTGMRVSEIAGLQVAEVDLDAAIIRVRKQLGKQAPRGRVDLKTRNSRRDIPIAPELRDTLERHMGGKDPHDFLFLSTTGRPINTSRAAVAVRRAAEHAGARRVHFHALRHYFASSLITAGVPIQDAARALGHTPAMMLKTYTHVMQDYTERVAEGISTGVGRGIAAGSPRLRVVGGSA